MRTSSEDEHTQRGRALLQITSPNEWTHGQTWASDAATPVSACLCLPRLAPTRHMAVVRLPQGVHGSLASFLRSVCKLCASACAATVLQRRGARAKRRLQARPGMELAAPSTLELDDRFTRQSRTACACETRAACDGSVREHGARSGRPQHAPLTLEAEADVHGSDSGAACMLCHRGRGEDVRDGCTGWRWTQCAHRCR